jgi:hypothetical protein
VKSDDKNPRMSILYHYSCLLHLPPIIRGGLSIGEIAQPQLRHRKMANAVSLTSQTDHDRLFFWGGSTSIPFKTAVRYVCKITEGDSNLEPARNLWKRLSLPSKAIKTFDPNGQSKWWYFYHGVIPPERFTVELWGSKGYVPLTSVQLPRIVSEMDVLRDEFEFIVPPDEPWTLDLKLKDESDKSPLWVLEESCPADRFSPMLT